MLVFYKNYLIYDWSTNNNNNNNSKFANSTIRICLSTMIEAFEVENFGQLPIIHLEDNKDLSSH
jgi:hypothetical protein